MRSIQPSPLLEAGMRLVCATAGAPLAPNKMAQNIGLTCMATSWMGSLVMAGVATTDAVACDGFAA